MKGVIAAANPDTAAAGGEIFRRGGNAVDAAVAAAFASFVAEFAVVNIGGGGYALTVMPARTGDRDPQVTSFDFFSTMPSKPVRATTLDFKCIQVDFGDEQQPYYIGRASTAVPGVVAGLCRLLERQGSLPLPVVLEPALKLAREGCRVSETMAEILCLLNGIFGDTPSCRQVFKSGEQWIQAGEVLRLPRLADAMVQLGAEGPDWFYRGALARGIVEDHDHRGGLITIEDLADYQVLEGEPIGLDYDGYRVWLPGESSAGGVLIAFALKLLAAIPRAHLQPFSENHLELLARVMQVTGIARRNWELLPGTPSQRTVALLSEASIADYATVLRGLIDGQAAPAASDPSRGAGNTSHISAIDEAGGAVSLTTSAGESAGYFIGDSGVGLNNMLGEMDLNPNGFHTAAPGSRLISMMSPTIVMNKGQVVMSIGSAGSNRLRSAILQTIQRVLDFDIPVAEAINHPRIHFEEGVLQMEGGHTGEQAKSMRRAGFQVNLWHTKHLFFGGTQAVVRQGDQLIGGADERRGGAVCRVD